MHPHHLILVPIHQLKPLQISKTLPRSIQQVSRYLRYSTNNSITATKKPSISASSSLRPSVWLHAFIAVLLTGILSGRTSSVFLVVLLACLYVSHANAVCNTVQVTITVPYGYQLDVTSQSD